MAQIIILNLKDDLRDKLRDRAQLNGRSMEEEVREILLAAIGGNTTSQSGLGTRISRRFADCHLDQNFDIPEWRGFEACPVRFNK